MALSGSISTNAYQPSGSNNTWSVIFNWTATQNTSTNTSKISWNLKSSTGSNSYVVISELRIKFGDEIIFYRGESKHTQGYDGTLLASGETTISHENNGAKSFDVTIEAGIYSHAINRRGSGTIILDTIPRASSITSAGNVTLGEACNIKWTPASFNFKYKLRFSIGQWSYTTNYIEPNTIFTYTYSGYTIPASDALLNEIPRSTGTMSVSLTTYDNAGKQIGAVSDSKTFTVTVPSNINPTMGTITLTPELINNQSILIHGKNKITVSVSGCSAGTGSGIASYTFSGPGISATQSHSSVISDGNIYASSTQDQTLTYTVTVTDGRGRSVSKTAEIICYAYEAPRFTEFKAYRVSSANSTTQSEKGEFIRCEYKLAYSSVNNTNRFTVDAYYKTGTGNFTKASSSNSNDVGSIILSDCLATSTYTVYLTVKDNYSNAVQSTQLSVFSSSKILNIRPDGSGVAFGKMAETDNTFEVQWQAKFHSDVTCDNIKCGDININSKSIFDLIYPVGSIYMSVDSTSPATLFGGTWERIQDRFLLAASDTYNAGTTGGSSTTTLTVENLPSHSHEATSEYTGGSLLIRGPSDANHNIVDDSLGNGNITKTAYEGDAWGNSISTSSTDRAPEQINIGGTVTTTIESTGDGKPIDILPPYLTVYMWTRTA